MYKKIIIFGIGEIGKKIIDEYMTYDCGVEIIGIADNYCKMKKYRSIPIITTSDICNVLYDEIWITTVYFKDIISQLVKIGVPKDKIFFMEPVLPVLEYRMRNQIIENTEDKKSVIDYFSKNHLRMYCYDFYDEYLMLDSVIEYDESAGMYYGLYKGKKLYISRKYNSEEKARAYFNAVIMEQDENSPHCYFNHEEIKNQRGISVDVGAAEGIYGLHIIDKIEHLYLIEIDSDWIDALKYTFVDYMHKVTIIRAYIGNKDNKLNMKLDTIFENIKVNTIKIDIEGEEMNALKGAEKILAYNDIHLAVCTYHHRDDNKKITDFLSHRGFDTENSKGFVVCYGEWELIRNETGFRKALLFADKVI